MTEANNIELYNDNELILYYKQSKDKNAIGILYKRYTHLVLGVSLKYLKNRDEAKDAVMQIFEKLISDLLKHNVDNFKSWLHSVTRNYCLMLLRKNNKNHLQPISDKNESELVETDLFLHPNTEAKEAMLQLMEKGITELKTEHRKCIELFYLKNKSYKDICDLTGYEMLEVKSFIQNGKRNLKIYMDKNIQHG